MIDDKKLEAKVKKAPAVLLILDGWGVAPDSSGNAITRADTPNFDKLTCKYYTSILHAAGESVGLKWGEIGNSEVGHLAIGTGRTAFQIQPRIDRSIIDNSFFKNEALLSAISHAKQNKSKLHLVGLLSDTGVHATVEHLYALLELAQNNELPDVLIHVILDGRDAPYNSGKRYMQQLIDKIEDLGIGKIASVAGRFWSMDRDNNWERIEPGYKVMVGNNDVSTYIDPIEAIEASYQKSIYDENFEPIKIVDTDGKGVGSMLSGDAIIFYNFRPDRMRQMLHAFKDDDFDKFYRTKLSNINIVSMALYDASLDVNVAFPPKDIRNTLAEVISNENMKQLHVAETEKYAHVTYFFDGGCEQPFKNEDREVVSSLGVKSYETDPQMSAFEIRDKVLSDLAMQNHDFYVVNFANADMVGHTGNFQATIKAVETIDGCVGEIMKAVFMLNGIIFLTADHGNAESLINLQTGAMDKQHTSHPVPFIIAGENYELAKVRDEVPDLSTAIPSGFLSDVAPTMLRVLGIKIPDEMSGRSLI